MIILINDNWANEKESNVSIFSSSFMYGFGVFETIRTYNHLPFRLDEHLDRLFCSAKQVGLNIKYNKAEISMMTEKVIRKSNQSSQRVKIIAADDKVIITSEKLTINKSLYKGVKTITFEGVRELPKAKTLSFLMSHIAHKKAVEEKVYEAILHSKDGTVSEGAYSNIFWFEKDTLCTNLDESLSGITAQTIIEISPYKFKNKRIHIDELKKKKQIFLTQTTKGVVPIIQVNKTPINRGVVGDKTLKLMELFDNLVDNASISASK